MIAGVAGSSPASEQMFHKDDWWPTLSKGISSLFYYWAKEKQLMLSIQGEILQKISLAIVHDHDQAVSINFLSANK